MEHLGERMRFIATALAGSYMVEVEKKVDSRGFFGRSWCEAEMKRQQLNGHIAQINTSRSALRGTLRGLHYQVAPYRECKLIRCTRGAIFDLIVDLRPESPTFLRWFGVELTEENHLALYSPEGFAQGFITLEDDTEIEYTTSQSYAPGYDWGVRWNDPQLRIELPVDVVAVSDKDNSWPDFRPEYLDKTALGA
jgi:dTDP-4-dehydrorhamnose 3,5-epimerase